MVKIGFFNRTARRAASSALIGMLFLTNTSLPALAQEAVPEPETQEYVVLAKNAKAAAEIEDGYSDDMLDGEETDIMEEEQTYLLELTEAEAGAIQSSGEDFEIEENILFTAASAGADGFEMFSDDFLSDLETDPGIAEDMDAGGTADIGANWSRSFIHADTEEVGGADGSGIKIAALDSGLAYGSGYECARRVDLVGNDLEDPLRLHYDLTGHGTGIHTALAVCAPGAFVASVRILDENNQASLGRVLAGIQWAIDNDIDIINMSFGTQVSSEILHRKIREAYDAGILLVGAAGNDGGAVLYPAAYEEVMAVGSADGEGNVSDFSAGGDTVEILAPGEGVITEGLFGGSMSVSGTSIAAAHVAAAAALLWSLEPDAGSDYIRRLLDASSNKSVSACGVVDAGMAYMSREAFAEAYSPQVSEYEEIAEERGDVENLGSDVIVSGCWSKANHKNQATAIGNEFVSGSGVNAQYITLMAQAAYIADDYYGIGSGNSCFYPLHGFGYTSGIGSNGIISMNNNYVADLKYLYRLARLYYTSSSIAAAEKNFSEVAAADSQGSFLKQLVSQKTVLPYGGRKGVVYETIYNAGIENTPQGAAWKILGLAVHMAGDIYAHRTRVPGSAADAGKLFGADSGQISYHTTKHNSSLPLSINSFLKEEHSNGGAKLKKPANVCVCKKCVRNAVSSGRVEFRDIMYVTKSDNIDDNVNIYPQRYNKGAAHAVRRLIKQMVNKADFTIHVFLPAESTGYTLKLNGLKDYIIRTKTDWNGLTQSTKNLVEKYSTAAVL